MMTFLVSVMTFNPLQNVSQHLVNISLHTNVIWIYYTGRVQVQEIYMVLIVLHSKLCASVHFNQIFDAIYKTGGGPIMIER